MRPILVGAAILMACGAAPREVRVVAAAPAEGEVERTPDAPAHHAVASRLAQMPPLPVAADLPWLALDDAQRDAVNAYEHALDRGTTITASCASGAVRVGPDAHQEPDDPGPALTWTARHEVETSASCEVTLGEVVACRAAVRDQPCRILGEGLPECDAIRECVENARLVAEHGAILLELFSRDR